MCTMCPWRRTWPQPTSLSRPRRFRDEERRRGAAPVSSSYVGASVKRLEDPRLLRGHGEYVADLKRAGMGYAAFLRTPHAHAEIRRVDLAAAGALPGVRLVMEGEQARGLARPFRVPMRAEHFRPTEFPHLASGKVRFVGEPVAMVVADDPYLALDALDLINAELEPVGAVSDVERATQPGAPLLHANAPNNVLFEHRHRGGDVEGAFASAAVIIKETFRHGRAAGLALENRAVLAEVDETSGHLKVWSSTQVPFTVRDALAASLGLDPDSILVTAPDVGGGFGIKAQVYAEEILVPLAARLLGCPVLWVGDRLEDLQSSAQARNQVVRVELAANQDGTITGLRAELLCDVGAYGIYPYGPALEALGTPSMLPGPYVLDNYAFTTRAVATNKPPEGAYRGVGMVVATFIHERLMDLLANEVGLDPAEVRRRNLIPPEALPYRTASGTLYDSGSFGASLELALDSADYAGLRQEQEQGRRSGRLLGIGIGCYTEFTGIGTAAFKARGMELLDGREGAHVWVEPDGRITACLSLPSQGQGLQTTFAQVLADELGVPLEQVAVQATDTATSPFGSGTFASRSAVLGGGAMRVACIDLRGQAISLASGMLEVSESDLAFERGAVVIRGAPDRRVTLAELSTEARRLGNAELNTRCEFDPAGSTFANATHLALVEVDGETGLVKILRYVVAEDCGRIINPMIVDGQVHGAVAQGIGGALYEELHYDEDGQLLTASLLDYVVPGAFEMPELDVRHLESPAPNSPLGTKGVGEGGTIGAAASIANAIADAIGAPVNRLPMTPVRVRQMVKNASARESDSTETRAGGSD